MLRLLRWQSSRKESQRSGGCMPSRSNSTVPRIRGVFDPDDVGAEVPEQGASEGSVELGSEVDD